MHTMTEDDILVLNFLVKFSRKPEEILEHTFYGFLGIDEIIPKKGCKPAKIILDMLTMHEFNKNLIKFKLLCEQKFVYRYWFGEKLRTFEFTNDMDLYSDIWIICFIYCVSLNEEINHNTFKVQNCKPLMDLTNVLLHKYNIANINIDPSDPSDTSLTVSRIAHSYPSITLDILHKSDKCRPISSLIYPSTSLPRTIFSEMISIVLPKLCDHPLALLLAIKVIIDDSKHFGKTPLIKMFTDIFSSYECTAFPQVLKLKLCTKLNIIHIDETQSRYKYNPCFAAFCKVAKIKIFKSRAGDPNLFDILSKI